MKKCSPNNKRKKPSNSNPTFLLYLLKTINTPKSVRENAQAISKIKTAFIDNKDIILKSFSQLIALTRKADGTITRIDRRIPIVYLNNALGAESTFPKFLLNQVGH